MKKIFKIKRIYILLLLPLIVATQCEDDDTYSGFETDYMIQNDSSIDLILFTEGGGQLPIPNATEFRVSSDISQTATAISPTTSNIFNNIKLYKVENENFILVYEQDPLDDELWVYNEPLENRFEYRLIITDALLD
jgi:hypothetical protein